MYTVVLDTCAVWSSVVRNLLLSFAAEGLYRPLFSSMTLQELRDCEFEKILPLVGAIEAEARADFLITEIRNHFEDAIIEGTERLEGTFGLPDPDDEHVLAAAVLGGAAAIVTENLKDFPGTSMPRDIEVLHPTSFILLTAELDQIRAVSALRVMATRTGRLGPTRTPRELLLEISARPGLGELVQILGRDID